MPEVLKTVGRYEILRELGRGGMAVVYLARQTDLDRFVALKELGAFHASDPSFAQRFVRESRVAGSLSHPNIVTVHDYFEHDGTPYIAMEYVERGSLRPFIGRMDLAQIGGVLEALLAGLTHGEQQGIVHRDLKPENLMVTSDGRVKIADFGIAKATKQMQTGAFLTATGTTVGTPTYMAPEQAMAQEVGPWTDLYSVGCMSFEMFTGKVPFHDSDAPMAILLRHVNEAIPSAKSMNPDVPDEIDQWIARLVKKDSKERYQSAADAWDDFEDFLVGMLGPRWRRSARLSDTGGDGPVTPVPLTPAPFDAAEGAESSAEFQSFAWGAKDTPPPGPATPPPSAAAPVPPAEVTPPGNGQPPAPEAPPVDEPAGETGFVTFGEPAPAAEAPPAPPAPEPDAPADQTPAAQGTDDYATFGAPAPEPPAAEAPPAPTTPEAPPEPEQEEGFETYIAPPAPRPPTDTKVEEAAMSTAPPVEEPPPAASPPPPPPPAPVTPEPPVAAPPPPPPPPPAPTPEPVAAADPGATIMPAALKRQQEERAAAERAAAEKARAEAAAKERREPREAGSAFKIGIGVGVLVAAVAGFILASGGGGGAEEVTTTPLAAAGVEVSTPAGFARVNAPQEIPGLSLDGAAAASPETGDRTIVVGVVKEAASNTTLLPPEFLAATGAAPGEIPPREAVKLGRLQAFRYENLSVKGIDKPVTVYVSPTSVGVATLVCIAPDAGCETTATTMNVAGGTPFPVGPSKDYATAVSEALAGVDAAVKKGGGEMRSAKTPKAQANAAETIQKAYAGAAETLGALELSPADRAANALLVAGLEAAAKAYRAAAKAADSSDKGDYARAERQVTAAQTQIEQALAALEAAGYQTG